MSATRFHRLQSADHGLHARPNLLILLQQVGSLRRQHVLSLFQGSVLVLKLVNDCHERVYTLFKAFQLELAARGEKA